jgi:hypothetical protein
VGFYYTKWNGGLQRTLVLRHFLTTKALQNDPRTEAGDWQYGGFFFGGFIDVVLAGSSNSFAESIHPSLSFVRSTTSFFIGVE